MTCWSIIQMYEMFISASKKEINTNKMCLRNINAPLVQISNGLHIYNKLSILQLQHCTKFGNYQANSSWNIEWTILRWRPVVWLWPFDHTSNKVFSKVNQCNKSGNHQIKDHQIMSKPLRMKISCLTFTLNHMISSEQIFPWGKHCIKVWQLSCKGVKSYWAHSIFS